MARIAGIELPKNKLLGIALNYIYGIGPVTSLEILTALEMDPRKRVKDLTESEVNKLSSYINQNYKIEGDLRREIQESVRRLVETGSYRGSRHRRGLPCRGQRTKTNARTKRGKRRTVGAVKAAKKTETTEKKG